jgi:dTDP-4-dehydrorhamnose 3,5-epimerase
MKVTVSALPEVLVLEPRVFRDDRGFFLESYNRSAFREATGVEANFLQDNHSRSARHVLRGLHYQLKQTQGKLVRVVAGEVFDVAVDLRRSSPCFGCWTGHLLSAENKSMLWIPPGFAHGFLALSEFADVLYKATDYYAPEHERCLLWSDGDIGIDWPLAGEPLVSEKDARGVALKHAETFA